jgi:hypothetical protein
VTADSLLALGADSADVAALRRLQNGAMLPPGSRQPWAREINVTGAPEWLEAAVERKLGQIGHLPVRDAVRAVAGDMLDYAPHMVFVLLPIFALLLKLLYWPRYYAEHFVFALHVHAFVFVMFIIILLQPWEAVTGTLVLWMAVYVWLAMKRVYGEGWIRTTLKWWLLGWSYTFLFSFGLVGLMTWALLAV